MDKVIGANLRRLRAYKSLTQKDVGIILDVTTQQVQKYEAGTNRLSATSVYILSQKWDINPYEFFVAIV